jgi:hypothetical protein
MIDYVRLPYLGDYVFTIYTRATELGPYLKHGIPVASNGIIV